MLFQNNILKLLIYLQDHLSLCDIWESAYTNMSEWSSNSHFNSQFMHVFILIFCLFSKFAFRRSCPFELLIACKFGVSSLRCGNVFSLIRRLCACVSSNDCGNESQQHPRFDSGIYNYLLICGLRWIWLRLEYKTFFFIHNIILQNRKNKYLIKLSMLYNVLVCNLFKLPKLYLIISINIIKVLYVILL